MDDLKYPNDVFLCIELITEREVPDSEGPIPQASLGGTDFINLGKLAYPCNDKLDLLSKTSRVISIEYDTPIRKRVQ